jgi:hypothetical protein
MNAMNGLTFELATNSNVGIVKSLTKIDRMLKKL